MSKIHIARQILRVPATEEATGYKRPSLYRLEKQGRFPRRVKLGTGQGGAVGWYADEVAEWQKARERGEDWSDTAVANA